MRNLIGKLATSVLAAGVSAGCAITPAGTESTESTSSALLDTTSLRDTKFSDANGWNQAQYYSTIHYPDLNNDGFSDLCGRGTQGITCAIDPGFIGGGASNMFQNYSIWSSAFSDANGWNQAQYYSTIKFPDVNHDGKPDVCARGVHGILCGISSGTSFGTLGTWSSAFSDANGWNQVQYYSTIRFPDVNGDGKPDVCARGISGVLCAVSNGSSFGSATTWSSTFSDAAGWNNAAYYTSIGFPDLNGDGKADVCGRGPSGIVCGISTGSSFGATQVWASSFSDAAGWNTSPAYYSTIQYSDLNGDGKQDVCGRASTGLQCALSEGATGGIGSFGQATLWQSSFSDANSWNKPQYYSTIQVTGGQVCARGSSGISCAFSNGSSFGALNLESANESDANGWTQPQYYKTIYVTNKINDRGSLGVYTGDDYFIH